MDLSPSERRAIEAYRAMQAELAEDLGPAFVALVETWCAGLRGIVAELART